MVAPDPSQQIVTLDWCRQLRREVQKVQLERRFQIINGKKTICKNASSLCKEKPAWTRLHICANVSVLNTIMDFLQVVEDPRQLAVTEVELPSRPWMAFYQTTLMNLQEQEPQGSY